MSNNPGIAVLQCECWCQTSGLWTQMVVSVTGDVSITKHCKRDTSFISAPANMLTGRQTSCFLVLFGEMKSAWLQIHAEEIHSIFKNYWAVFNTGVWVIVGLFEGQTQRWGHE